MFRLVYFFILFICAKLSLSLDEKIKDNFLNACKKGDYNDISQIIFSLDNNPDVLGKLLNDKDNSGYTPLYYVIKEANLELENEISKNKRYNIIKLLALYKANPNLSFPLHEIVRKQDLGLLKVFLTSFYSSIDINILDANNYSALYYAINVYNSDILEYLLNFDRINIYDNIIKNHL